MERDEIAAYVERFAKPKVATIADDIHIFHFEQDGYWQDSPICLVNRNGNHFRIIRQGDGDWLFARTWSGLFECKDWEIGANLRRPDPLNLIQLAGSGPQSNKPDAFESLCLLPKGSTTGRRKTVWRGTVMDASFDQRGGTFMLWPGGNPSPAFPGKLWESREAVDWCRTTLVDQATVEEVKVRKAFGDEQIAALEDNPLFGLF